MIGLIILIVVITIFGLKSSSNEQLLGKVIAEKNVDYCKEMNDRGAAPGPIPNCISLVAQASDDNSICEELYGIHDLGVSDCYAHYASYKNDETLCEESKCSKTLFETCINNPNAGCPNLKNY